MEGIETKNWWGNTVLIAYQLGGVYTGKAPMT